jgi:hypothetical protein
VAGSARSSKSGSQSADCRQLREGVMSPG